MRERLTVAFVAVTVTLLLGALLTRSYTAETRLRTFERIEVDAQATRLAAVIDLVWADTGTVSEEFLQKLVGDDQLLRVEVDSAAPVEIEGAEFTTDDDGEDFTAVRRLPSGGTLTLIQSDDSVDELVGDERGSIALMLLLVAGIAAAVGFLVSRLLAAPFLKLAVAARQLGRGRFDLDLPSTRIPEARSLAQALKSSAGHLQERLAGEHAFAQHASHVLRTPLTGLRLDLEDLTLRDDLPDDVRETAAHAVVRLERMDEIAGELVDLSRSNSLMVGAEVPLHELARACAQTWADALAPQRTLTAAVDGRVETPYTPGPIEYVLDLLLDDIVRNGLGAVRMTFDADPDGLLTIEVTSEGGTETTVENRAVAQARAVITALGGRLNHDRAGEGFTILLPRR
ncbi:histidine kinase dimerization/phospho-acceptor domain-containing protein [Nocardioides sp.]|uniref:sensor histidine kinase n=1 Tax=Nocardioides sp. TaxID=35761 RepID=UPI003562787A